MLFNERPTDNSDSSWRTTFNLMDDVEERPGFRLRERATPFRCVRLWEMVGAAGIEPATSCVSSKRSPTELSARVQLHLFSVRALFYLLEIPPLFPGRAARCQRSAPAGLRALISGRVERRGVAKFWATGKRGPCREQPARNCHASAVGEREPPFSANISRSGYPNSI
jgi:hypothetical protein